MAKLFAKIGDADHTSSASVLVLHCYLFYVCVEVLRSSQRIRAMSGAVSLPNHIFVWADLIL